MTENERPEQRSRQRKQSGVCANRAGESGQEALALLSAQERALQKAVGAYLDLPALRRLAASAEDLQTVLKSSEEVPHDVQDLLRLLQALLKPGPDERILQPDDVAGLLKLKLGYLDHEEFWEICLDRKNHVQRMHRLYVGSINEATMRVGELFRLPLLLNSASLIVVHNHPGGDPKPSPEDIEATRLIIQAGELLQVEVLDHLIIGQGRWLSLRTEGLGW